MTNANGVNSGDEGDDNVKMPKLKSKRRSMKINVTAGHPPDRSPGSSSLANSNLEQVNGQESFSKLAEVASKINNNEHNKQRRKSAAPSPISQNDHLPAKTSSTQEVADWSRRMTVANKDVFKGVKAERKVLPNISS